MTKPGVIVFEGHVQGLGLVRDFGRKNIPVYLVDNKALCIGRFSKYLKKFFHVKNTEIVEFLIELAGKENLKGWVLMPSNDLLVAEISKNKEKLSRYYNIPFPGWKIIEKAYNKIITYQIAENEGIEIPKTFYPNNLKDLKAIANKVDYPVIIKPAIMHKFYKKTKSKAFVANDLNELEREYLKACKIVEPSEIIIQEIIPGREMYSFYSFFKEGIKSYCIGKRIRQIPQDFGTSTIAEIIDIPELYDLSYKILKEIGYYGLSEVEFKKDSRDGKFKFIEINPRTWKQHTLAIKAGIDFPYIVYADILNINQKKEHNIKIGVKWIEIYSDLYVAINEICRRKLTLRDYFKSIKGEKEFAVFSFSDPLPFIAETLLLPYLFRAR